MTVNHTNSSTELSETYFQSCCEKGDIEYEYRFGPTFYTLPGIKFGKPMTVNHTEGINHSSNAVGTDFFKTKDLPPMPP